MCCIRGVAEIARNDPKKNNAYLSAKQSINLYKTELYQSVYFLLLYLYVSHHDLLEFVPSKFYLELVH